jgi:tetratricopeptide (TPR) repeat protein
VLAVVLLAGLGLGAFVYALSWRNTESLWRSAIEARPDCWNCYQHLGQQLAARGELGEAEEMLTTALANRPSLYHANVQLAMILATTERAPEAIEMFLWASQLQPNDPVPLGLAAQVAEASGEDERALELHRQLAKQFPQMPRALLSLGAASLRLGGADGCDEVARVLAAPALTSQELASQDERAQLVEVRREFSRICQ